MATDEQLILEFQRGSAAAFEELFQRYRNPVYGFFRRRLNDAGRAEDLTQETFVIIIRGAERYRPEAKFRTYLYAIALKLLWTERRKQAREMRDSEVVPEAQQEANPVAALWVRDALGRLETDQREILMLREYEQLSYDEIAELLRIPVNTVRSRLFRARADLKVFLQPQTAGETSR
jgi:RNA polymerase sigma-70 factor (ECF subfamily)